jgi:hypothetical protein
MGWDGIYEDKIPKPKPLNSKSQTKTIKPPTKPPNQNPPTKTPKTRKKKNHVNEMNGWIETRNPGVLSYVSNEDIVFRSSTLASRVVIGNASKAVAGMYVSDNTVGIRRLPGEGVSLDVKGPVRFTSALGDAVLAFGPDGVSTRFGASSNTFEVSNAGMLTSSPGGHKVSVGFNGSVNASQVIASGFFKVVKEFPNARVIRIFPSVSCDISGVSHSDFDGVTHVRIQDIVLKVESRDIFFDSVHLTFEPYDSQTQIQVGPAFLAVLDSSLNTMNRLGPLTLTKTEHTKRMTALSCTRVGSGMLLTIASIPDLPRAGDFIRLSVPLVDEMTFFNVRSVEHFEHYATLEIYHSDYSTDVSLAFPATLASLVGYTSVYVSVIPLMVPERQVIRLKDIAVAFQPSKILMDRDASMDDQRFSTVSIRWTDTVFTYTTSGQRLASNSKVVFDVLETPTAMTSGIAQEVHLTQSGIRAMVQSSHFSGSTLRLTVEVSQEVKFSRELCIMSDPASTILWVCESAVKNQDGYALTLSMANSTDIGRFGTYSMNSTIFMLPFAPETIQTLSGKDSFLLDTPSFACSTITSSKIETESVKTTTVVSSADLSITAKKINVDAECMNLGSTKLTTSGFSIGEGLSASFSSPIVAPDFDRILTTLDLPADANRSYANFYDANIGRFVASLGLPFEPGALLGARFAYIDGVKFTLSDDLRSAFVESEGMFSRGLPDATLARKILLCPPPQKNEMETVFQVTVVSCTADKMVVNCVDNLLKHIEHMVGIGPHNLSVYVISGCTNSGASGLWSLELELVGGSPFPFFQGLKVSMALLTSPVPCVVREIMSSIAFSTTSMNESSMKVGPPPDTILEASRGSAIVASLSAPIGAGLVTVHPVSVSVKDMELDLKLSEIAMPTMIAANGPIMVRMILRGAQVALDGIREAGQDTFIINVSLTNRRTLDVSRLLKFVDKTIFAFSRPWRLEAVSQRDTVLKMTLTLKRLGPPIPLETFIGQAVFLMPVEPGLTSTLYVDDAIVFKGPRTIDVVDGRLVLDSTLILSSDDAYATFAKGLFVQGNLVAQTVSHVSDRVFKRNIVKRSPIQDLAILRELNVYDYSFMDGEGGPGTREFGVLADEVEALLPEAIRQVEGFVPNVYSNASFTGGMLVVQGLHGDKMKTGELFQLGEVGGGMKIRARVLSVHESESSTFVTIDEKLETRDYFVYGTQTHYKVANTTHLLMACLNAIKALSPF